MNDLPALHFAQYFVQHHPQAAARAIEKLPADSAGEFIDRIDDSSSETVLMSLLPYHAAKCIESLSDETAARYLTKLNPRAAARIMRQVTEVRKDKLLNLIPRHKALHIAVILGYPQSLIGAWMDPTVLPLPVTATVSEMRERITTDRYPYTILFAVDDQNHVLGSVSLIDLLRQTKDEKAISNIMRSDISPLFASMTLSRALKDDVWATLDTLPVVDRDQKLVGVLSYNELRQAVNRSSQNREVMQSSQNFLGITESFCLGLAELISTALESPKKPNQSTDTD